MSSLEQVRLNDTTPRRSRCFSPREVATEVTLLTSVAVSTLVAMSYIRELRLLSCGGRACPELFSLPDGLLSSNRALSWIHVVAFPRNC